MGLTDLLAGGKAYLDSNTLIYAIERVEGFVALVEDLLPAIDAEKIQAVTSELALAEALVKPFADGNEELANDYQGVIQPRPALQVIPVSRAVLVAAARLRAATGLKLPDAIHAATCP